jgi:hypothetical protein
LAGESAPAGAREHPFWNTHYPPNGWGCGCTVEATEGPADGDATEPPEGWNEPDARGRLPGIDRGWAYAPGKSITDEMRGIVADKAGKYPEALAEDFLAEMEKGGITPAKPAAPAPTPAPAPAAPPLQMIAPEKMAELDEEARDYVLDQGKNGIEYVFAYDARTGKILAQGTNKIPDKVGIPKEYTQDASMRIVAHHSHPSISSLSLGDLEVLSRRGVIRVVAHCVDNSQFTATKGDRIDDLADVAEIARWNTIKQINVLAKYGLYPHGFETHIRNMALHQAGVIEYDAKLDDIRNRFYNEQATLIDSAVENVAAAIKKALPP